MRWKIKPWLRWKGFYGMDMDRLLVVKGSVHFVLVRQWSVLHAYSGFVTFALRCTMVGDMVGYFYRFQVYIDLWMVLHGLKQYEKRIITMYVGNNIAYAQKLPDEALDGDHKKWTVCIVPVSLFAGRYINDGRYLENDEGMTKNLDGNRRKFIV